MTGRLLTFPELKEAGPRSATEAAAAGWVSLRLFLACQSDHTFLLRMMDVLTPPKAKLLDMACSTSRSLPCPMM